MRPLLLLCLLLTSSLAWAGKPGRKDEAALRALHDRYAHAIEVADWEAAAALMHPEALARFREMLGDLMTLEGPDGTTLATVLLDGTRVDELEGLDDAGFYARFLASMTRMVPALQEAMASTRMETRAIAFDAAGEAFVVYDMTMSPMGVEVHKLGVTSARRTDDGWGFLLSGDIAGLAQGFRAQIEQLQAAENASKADTTEAPAPAPPAPAPEPTP
ncbi:MAG: hypothetical protein H6732_00155 [Alphaproteobacteria bacterium]|nr:hypothetical protein [Alphaproteobacteria bacterium]